MDHSTKGRIISTKSSRGSFMGFISILGRNERASDRRRRQRSSWLTLLLPSFTVVYVVIVLVYLYIYGSSAKGCRRKTDMSASEEIPQRIPHYRRGSFGQAKLPDSLVIERSQKVLCRLRANAPRTIVVHMHIPKSGGTAFALALKSECRCRQIPRPQKGYCKECPHVLPDRDLGVTKLRQNLWTLKNESFSPPYTANCKTYNASSRWFGFQQRNRTYTFYSQNRLTSGWPCGVHVGYARLRMCCHRLKLPGVKHVMVTLFREPLARFVSEFYQVAYNRRVISSWDWCMNRIPPLSMTEFFGMPVSFPFQSRMTKLLSGSPIQTGAAGADWTDSGVRGTALERALGVIDSTEDFFFGLAEELELTLELFQFAFRRSFKAPSSCHSHQNSSHGGCAKVELGLHDLNGKPLTLTSEQKRLFDRNNYEDKQVYQRASRVFHERVEAMRSLKMLGSDLAVDRKCSQLLDWERGLGLL